MIKAKLLAIFAGMIATLAVSAVPAFAEFQSNSAATKGTGKSGVVTLSGGGATLECSSAEGTWTILSGGVPATKGTVLSLEIAKWVGCKAKTKGGITATPTVKVCTLHLTQAAGSTSAKGSVFGAACTVVSKILFITCTITVPPESGATNKELLTNTLSNSGSDLITKANDTGITSEAKNCPGVENTTNASQVATVTGVGLKEV